MEQQINSMKINNDDIKFENTNFSIMSIPPSSLDGINFNDPNYISHILNKLQVHPVSKDNFLESLAKYSNIKEYPTCHNMETEIIGFNSKYVYEMSFLSFSDDNSNPPDNDIGTVLNINGNKIKGTCLIFKSYISNTDYSMMIDNIVVNDIAELLISRKSPKMVICEDGDWREEDVADLDKFKKKLFGEQYVKETSLDFMTYSLNILYVKSDYGSECIPEIVEGKMESVVIYSVYGNMKDNFTIEELNKIKHLLKKNIKTIDNDILNVDKDNMGRKIINTKYRLLNLMYRKNL
tara:strand:- start:549 stop:1427 length:879 start_codon:yes stop_codon:yes gene_type:complete